jgi:hypothetical protein
MKKILTALLLVASLSGVLVAAEVRGATRSSETTVNVARNTAYPALLQRWRRQRRRRMVRYVRRNRNNGRWNNRRGNNGRWNNRRWNNRRGRRRGNSGHDVH